MDFKQLVFFLVLHFPKSWKLIEEGYSTPDKPRIRGDRHPRREIVKVIVNSMDELLELQEHVSHGVYDLIGPKADIRAQVADQLSK